MNNILAELRPDQAEFVTSFLDQWTLEGIRSKRELQLKLEGALEWGLHPPETSLTAKKIIAQLDSPGNDQHLSTIATLEIVNKLLDYKIAINLQPRTIENYHQVLYSFAREYPTLPSSHEEILAFLKSKPSGGTRLNIYKVLSVLYKFANERLGTTNIMLSLQKPRVKPKEPECLTLNQLIALQDAIETARELGLFNLYAGEALRLSEALRLDIKDVGEDLLRIKGKERDESMPLLPEVRDALLKLAGNRGPNEPLFISGQGRRLGRDMAEENIKRLFVRASVIVPQMSPKVFRSTFTSMAAAAGCNSFIIKRLVRHSGGWDVTEHHYIHLSNEDLMKALEKYSPLRLIKSGFGQTTGR
jgi:integrase/recombinase XerD